MPYARVPLPFLFLACVRLQAHPQSHRSFTPGLATPATTRSSVRAAPAPIYGTSSQDSAAAPHSTKRKDLYTHRAYCAPVSSAKNSLLPSFTPARERIAHMSSSLHSSSRSVQVQVSYTHSVTVTLTASLPRRYPIVFNSADRRTYGCSARTASDRTMVVRLLFFFIHNRAK
jgi:hypothetical protein